MTDIVNFPIVVFALSLVGLWLAARVGDAVRVKWRPMNEGEREDFSVVIGATLTLLGLLIGFSFSMAVSRYDQRKRCEAEEANAIGTEYVRVELLPSPTASDIQQLLTKYLEQRVLFYEIRDKRRLQQIDADTAHLQSELWIQIRSVATAQATPVMALAASGMNDVLNSQAYTQAAWWNRIPGAAWTLMATIAVCCNLLLGYSWRRNGRPVRIVLPLAVSISFFLIADMDSPRGGFIRPYPSSLISLSHSLRAS